jgi:hypothetical protein
MASSVVAKSLSIVAVVDMTEITITTSEAETGTIIRGIRRPMRLRG